MTSLGRGASFPLAKINEPQTTQKIRVVHGSWLTGSWLLRDIHFQVVLARLAAEGHVLDLGVRPDGEQRLPAVGAAVPRAVMDGLNHDPSPFYT